MKTAIVHHDGLQLPLDTFIDAYRLVRVDPYHLPVLDRDTRLLIVDSQGQVQPDRRAGEIDLRSIAAFRAIDGQMHHEPCFLCGTSQDNQDTCDDCNNDGDWY